MAIRAIGGYNGFMPQATTTAVGFVRDPKNFKHLGYSQLVKAPAPQAYYKKLDLDQPSRMVDPNESLWKDGDLRPQPNTNVLRWEDKPILIQRYNFSFPLGYQAIETSRNFANIDSEMLANKILLQQAMTARATRILSKLQTTGNWPSSNTDTATNLGGGKWDASTASTKYIQTCLGTVSQKINLLTAGAISGPEYLRLIISPKLAITLALNEEIRDLLKQSQYAMDRLTWRNQQWGLPDMIAGYELYVEDVSSTTSRPNADGTPATVGTDRNYLLSNTNAIVVSKEPGMDGGFGLPNFSTVQIYYYDYEMSVEAFDDPENKRISINVVDQTEVVIIPESGYLIQATI